MVGTFGLVKRSALELLHESDPTQKFEQNCQAAKRGHRPQGVADLISRQLKRNLTSCQSFCSDASGEFCFTTYSLINVWNRRGSPRPQANFGFWVKFSLENRRGDHTQHPAHSIVVNFELSAPGAFLLLLGALLRLSPVRGADPGTRKQRRLARGVSRCRFCGILSPLFGRALLPSTKTVPSLSVNHHVVQKAD